MEPITLPGIYLHIKGALYEVYGNMYNATDNSYRPMVAYRSLSPRGWMDLFVRDAVQFHEPMDWPDGVRRSRFLGPMDIHQAAEMQKKVFGGTL